MALQHTNGQKLKVALRRLTKLGRAESEDKHAYKELPLIDYTDDIWTIHWWKAVRIRQDAIENLKEKKRDQFSLKLLEYIKISSVVQRCQWIKHENKLVEIV